MITIEVCERHGTSIRLGETYSEPCHICYDEKCQELHCNNLKDWINHYRVRAEMADDFKKQRDKARDEIAILERSVAGRVGEIEHRDKMIAILRGEIVEARAGINR